MSWALILLMTATFPDWLVVAGSKPKIVQAGGQMESTFQLGGNTTQATAYYKQLLEGKGFVVSTPKDLALSGSRGEERVNVTLQQNGEAVDVKIVVSGAAKRNGSLVPRYPNGRLDQSFQARGDGQGMRWLTADGPAQAEAWYAKALTTAGFAIQSRGKSPEFGVAGNTIIALHSSGEHAVRVNFVPLLSTPNYGCVKEKDNAFAGVMGCNSMPQSDRTAVELTYTRVK